MKRFGISLMAAYNGLRYVARNETNFRIHLVFAVLVMAGGLLFSISSMQWILLILAMAFVLCAEIFNTAIEVLCNKVQPQQDPLIRIIKDVAAGAVLLSAITAILIGLFIFLPYCIMLYKLFLL